jgi:hypothetical protein
VYLRETRRTNKDGSVVSYLQLAHSERHPVSGSPVAAVIHNFGRADKVDREALRRLVSSISRFLEPGEVSVQVPPGSQVRIPDVSVHLFRSNPYTDSDRFRTPRAGRPRSAGVR